MRTRRHAVRRRGQRRAQERASTFRYGPGCLAELCVYAGIGLGSVAGCVVASRTGGQPSTIGDIDVLFPWLVGGLLVGCILAILVLIWAIRSGRTEP